MPTCNCDFECENEYHAWGLRLKFLFFFSFFFSFSKIDNLRLLQSYDDYNCIFGTVSIKGPIIIFHLKGHAVKLKCVDYNAKKCLFNPLNPGQFTRRVYHLPGPIRDKEPVSVSVSVFWQRKFRQLLHFTYFHNYCLLTGTMYSSVSVSKIWFFDYITSLHCP